MHRNENLNRSKMIKMICMDDQPQQKRDDMHRRPSTPTAARGYAWMTTNPNRSKMICLEDHQRPQQQDDMHGTPPTTTEAR